MSTATAVAPPSAVASTSTSTVAAPTSTSQSQSSDPPPDPTPPVDVSEQEEVVLTTAEDAPQEEEELPFKWYLKDRLALFTAIVTHGENWPVVDDTMQKYAETAVEMEQEEDEEVWRPDDWYSHDSCVQEYNRILEEERKWQIEKGVTGADSADSATLAEAILANLEDARVEQLEAEIEQGVLHYKAGLDDIQRMEAGNFGHVMEIVHDNEGFKRFMVDEGMEEELNEALKSYYDWQDMSPKEREEAEKAALAAEAAAPLQVETKGSEGRTMAPPAAPTTSGTGPASPKVSPQLKNLVYSAIAGTQEEVGNLPAPASSPTLSMLLEMPPRGHGQPLPEIPTVVPQRETTPARESTVADEGAREMQTDTEREIDVKLESNVQISPLKGLAEIKQEVEESQDKKSGKHARASESPIKTVREAAESDGTSTDRVPTADSAPSSQGDGSTSDNETTITGSITPPSQRGPGSVVSSPATGGAPTPTIGRVTRRTAVPEPSGLEEGKSLRGRTIVTTPTKDEAAAGASATKDKVRVKLEFDSSTKTLKKPAPVDFKTVAMKEKEGEQAGRDLRSRRGGGTTPSPSITSGTPSSATKKKDASDDEEFADGRSELAPSVTDDEESAARATERWVEGSGGTETASTPSKPTLTPAPGAGSATVHSAPAGVRKKRGDSSEERGSGTTSEKEGEDKRVTRARTRTTPSAAGPAPASSITTAKTMTPPPTLTPAPSVGPPREARATPEPEGASATPGSSAPSRALRSRRMPDSFSFSGTEPSSPAPYSTPHSPASSTVSAMFEDSASSSGVGHHHEDKNMKRALLSLHRLVTNLKHGYLFIKSSVPKWSKVHFDELVRRPLDFIVIKRNIEADVIRTFEQYQQQVYIMFMNHLMYFNETTDLYKQTRIMANETFDIIEDFIRNYNESNAPGASAGSKRESRRDLRHSYSTTSTSARKSTPTPSVADSSRGGAASGSEESHDETRGRKPLKPGPTPTGAGRGRKKRVDLSPNISTDDPPRRGPGRIPRSALAPPPPTKTRHSAV